MRAPTRSRLPAFLAILIAICFLPLQAQAASSNVNLPLVTVFDAVVLRPLGFCGFLIGAVLFVPAAIITAPGGSEAIKEAREVFIDYPAEIVFERELGDI